MEIEVTKKELEEIKKYASGSKIYQKIKVDEKEKVVYTYYE